MSGHHKWTTIIHKGVLRSMNDVFGERKPVAKPSYKPLPTVLFIKYDSDYDDGKHFDVKDNVLELVYDAIKPTEIGIYRLEKVEKFIKTVEKVRT